MDGPDRHRIRRWRIGEDEVLRSFRREDLLEFTDSTYRPENMVVVVAGDIETDNIRTAIERHWGGVPRGRVIKEKSDEEPARHELRFHRMRGDIQQRIMVAGFHAPPYRSADSPALAALDPSGSGQGPSRRRPYSS